MKKLILASGSPRRKELLEQIGLEFRVVTSDAEEKTSCTAPGERVEALSGIKADAVFNRLSQVERAASIVIGADTIVYQNGRVLGKPKDEADAVQMLGALSGGVHSVYTGVTLLAADRRYSFHEHTRVWVYDLTESEIQQYVRTKDPLDKAGAYGIQGAFAAYIKGIEGDYNTVVGLPVGRVYQELKKWRER